MRGREKVTTPQLRTADRVFAKDDLDSDELPSLGIVTGVREKPAGEITVTKDGEAIPLHEYGANSEYADETDAVVNVVFADWLTSNIPDWDEHAAGPKDLTDHLEHYIDVWSIPVGQNTYDFPESRLSLRTRPTEDDTNE